MSDNEHGIDPDVSLLGPDDFSLSEQISGLPDDLDVSDISAVSDDSDEIEALSEVCDDLQTQNRVLAKKCEFLEKLIAEANAEMDKHGAPPSNKGVHTRLRTFIGVLREAQTAPVVDPGVAPNVDVAEPPGTELPTVAAPYPKKRRRLQDTRNSITHKFEIDGHEGYLTVGMYEDGTPGEIFIRMAKEGSTISGLMDSFALSVSMGLQHGVSLKTYCDKLEHTQFAPSGFTANAEIRRATSIMDYLFRFLRMKFLPETPSTDLSQLNLGLNESVPESKPDMVDSSK